MIFRGKLFGEYLVELGYIKSTDLLNILIEQIKDQPSMAEIVFKQKLLPESTQLEILNHQCRVGSEYGEACRSLNLWTKDLEHALEIERAKIRIPLGQKIVGSGLLGFEKITGILDDFLKLDRSQLKATPPAESELNISHLDLTFRIIEPALLSEYCRLPCHFEHRQIIETLTHQGDASTHPQLNEILRQAEKISKNFKSIQRAANFIRAKLTERVAIEGLLLVDNIIATQSNKNHKISQYWSLILEFLKIIQDITMILESSRSEEGYWVNGAQRDFYLSALSRSTSVQQNKE